MTTALKFIDVSKNYGQLSVLSQINFEIQAGEFFGLVGLNGVGKSTLIKCLLDFCNIDKGTIKIFSDDHTNTSSRSSIAYLPEKFIPPYYLTGRSFIRMMSELHGYKYDEEETKNKLHILDLDPSALSKPVYQYSKGMGQKLGLLSCLLSKKKLLILDEPMSGLDPRAMVFFKKYLLELKEQGYTLFFSTHHLVDIETLCDQMAILHKGNIRFLGTPEECRESYCAENLDEAFIKCVE